MYLPGTISLKKRGAYNLEDEEFSLLQVHKPPA